ncbi:MAG: V-type ATP synthase subunit A [Phycisphaerae bacterium]|nr:V-type ATP synthase subunit A [Phycisphaerae bacterium]
MVIAEIDGRVVQNAVGTCHRQDGAELLSEVIRVRGKLADLQVFEETRGLKVGDKVTFRDEMLSVTLGPGLLGQIYDGLQNPLPELADAVGYFLEPGHYIHGLNTEAKWAFTPTAETGATVRAGDVLGFVPEGMFTHQIMVPFAWRGEYKVASVAKAGEYTVADTIATLTDADGNEHPVTMQQDWPVKREMSAFKRRLMPSDPLVTRVRIIDTMFPVVRGGTYCIPGPFGAGKTVLQQITSRHAEIDVVVLTACGERAGEVVETIREFPELTDPRTGKSLMERTIIVCNTSAMPVAARDASVYTGVTLAEYYRQMGLDVLLLADSTSRWAQAMREISGRLEEIPGEEAYPAYLESRIADFYERAGAVELNDGRTASVTVGGTVSPAGGNFEEPVTQGTLKVVGAFHGLSRERSDARRYPAIDPLDSWSQYTGIIDAKKAGRVRALLRRGNEVRQMMTVVGEEGTPIDDFTAMLKAEFVDSVYLQQNAFDPVDAATPRERQEFVFGKVLDVVDLDFGFENKDDARKVMFRATDLFRNWNYAPWLPEGTNEHETEEETTTPNGQAQPQEPGADQGDQKQGEGENEGGKDQTRSEEEIVEGRSEEFKRILGEIEAFIAAKGRTGAQESDESKQAEPQEATAAE